jgi:hypothetical protein
MLANARDATTTAPTQKPTSEIQEPCFFTAASGCSME